MTTPEARKQMMETLFDKRKAEKEETRFESLTVEVYKKLKKDDMTDTAIMKVYGMHSVAFYNWKKDNGLIRQKKTDAPVKKEVEEQVEKKVEKEVEQSPLIARSKYEEVKKELSDLKAANKEQKVGFAPLSEFDELNAAHKNALHQIDEQDKLIQSLSNEKGAEKEELRHQLQVEIRELEQALSASKNEQTVLRNINKRQLAEIELLKKPSIDYKETAEELHAKANTLEMKIAEHVDERNKQAADYFELADRAKAQAAEIEKLSRENERLNHFKFYLMEDSLKTITAFSETVVNQKEGVRTR